jgi:8-oxo-dGTP diphosphatase
MTAVDNLWYLADEADQRAAQSYHRLQEEYDATLEVDRTRHVSRERFRTVSDRIRENGLPYGVHTLVRRESGEILLVRHEGVDMWVIPGGELEPGEGLLDGARRELAEEAGIDATYDGMGILAQVDFFSDGHDTWGVLPVFEARPDTVDPEVDDPDDEISEARWFDELPTDTRDRDVLQAWRDRTGI